MRGLPKEVRGWPREVRDCGWAGQGLVDKRERMGPRMALWLKNEGLADRSEGSGVRAGNITGRHGSSRSGMEHP